MKALMQRILIIPLLLIQINVWSQYTGCKSGPNGIFVYFGRDLPIDFQYKLERSNANSNEWIEIMRTGNTDYQFSAVYSKLLQASAKNSAFAIPDSSEVEYFIKLLKGKKRIDSVYVYNGLPAFIEAMGTGFYDISVKAGEMYDYRISEMNKKGDVMKAHVVKADKVPGQTQIEKPLLVDSQTSDNKLVFNYAFQMGSNVRNVRILKKITLQTPFKEVFPEKYFSKNDQIIHLTIIDDNLTKGLQYQYIIVPVDLLGNAGTPSDTLTLNLGLGDVPPIQHFETKEVNGFIQLKWRTPKQANMRSISIYRSDNFDGNFEQISQVGIHDSIFIDRHITKGNSYYYYLVFEGLMGNSAPTATVIGYTDLIEKPTLKPYTLKVESRVEGNFLTWKRTDNQTKGYYIYRGEGYQSESELISSLLISDDELISFIDSSSHLVPGAIYNYAVSSVNHGNIEGPKTESVVSSPQKPDLPTPLNLLVKRHQNTALLVWDDMQPISKYITGYKVLRTENNQPEYQEITTTETNIFVDTLIIRGKNYTYRIKAVGISESESAPSAEFSFKLPDINPVAPAGVRLTKTAEGIILYWDTPGIDNLSAIKIYREMLGDKPKLIATLKPDIQSYNDKISKAGTYFYTISSVSGDGKESGVSEELGVEINKK